MRRAKEQQVRVDQRRRFVKTHAAGLQQQAEEKQNEAEDWLKAQTSDEDGYPVEYDNDATVSALAALAAAKGAQQAQVLYKGVQKARKEEVIRAKKGSEQTTAVMAEEFDDRGMSECPIVRWVHQAYRDC